MICEELARTAFELVIDLVHDKASVTFFASVTTSNETPTERGVRCEAHLLEKVSFPLSQPDEFKPSVRQIHLVVKRRIGTPALMRRDLMYA